MSLRRDIRSAVIGAMIVALMLVPAYGALSGDSFAISLGTRILILALAATSLNLILGYGGMVSFGHAAYLGIGGYAVGILADAGIVSGWVQWSVAVAVSALAALVIGALCLRTRGVNFIMITLAFAQMIYYVASGLDQYGGDDGLIISTRSQFSLINLTDRTQFYYLCAALLLGAILLSKRMMDARFGWVVRGARSNERRMRALGFPIFGCRLLCFVIAGGVCGLAGALLANRILAAHPRPLAAAGRCGGPRRPLWPARRLGACLSGARVGALRAPAGLPPWVYDAGSSLLGGYEKIEIAALIGLQHALLKQPCVSPFGQCR